MAKELDFTVMKLGECTIPSPMSGVRFVKEDDHILYHSDIREIRQYIAAGKEPPHFEEAGPREKIFFDPAGLACGIVTCGGLCPGLNNVIRAIVLSLHHHYGVKKIYGFPYGYEGLSPRFGHEPVQLTPEVVVNIDEMGGTILGSSRGNQDISEMVDMLNKMNIGILSDIGIFLREVIKDHFKKTGMEITLKYIDPSYTIRSVPANPHDSALCLLLGHNAVHAGMTGRTGIIIGFWNQHFTHVPIPLAVAERKKIDPEGWVWRSVLSSTGQPRDMR
jgi:hypothetical protein